jgi:mRNA interferase RelE/StbE
MAYSIFITPAAKRQLGKLPVATQKEVVSIIETLAEDPRPIGCLKLKNQDRYRVRARYSYRIVYEIRDDTLVVTIIKIGHRREVYR